MNWAVFGKTADFCYIQPPTRKGKLKDKFYGRINPLPMGNTYRLLDTRISNVCQIHQRNDRGLPKNVLQKSR
jgi:hypothetical protein